MRQEFDLEDTWVPYEIHPKLPVGGTPWGEYFRGMDSEAFFRQLDAKGRELGVRFNHQPNMSNTHRALTGGEFARDHGRYHQYHDAVFKAYFTDCRDIGDMAVLRDVAGEARLPVEAFEAAVLGGTYLPRLEQTMENARENRVGAAPTFIIEGYGKLTGAQPAETFRAVFAGILNRKNE